MKTNQTNSKQPTPPPPPFAFPLLSTKHPLEQANFHRPAGLHAPSMARSRPLRAAGAARDAHGVPRGAHGAARGGSGRAPSRPRGAERPRPVTAGGVPAPCPAPRLPPPLLFGAQEPRAAAAPDLLLLAALGAHRGGCRRVHRVAGRPGPAEVAGPAPPHGPGPLRPAYTRHRDPSATTPAESRWPHQAAAASGGARGGETGGTRGKGTRRRGGRGGSASRGMPLGIAAAWRPKRWQKGKG